MGREMNDTPCHTQTDEHNDAYIRAYEQEPDYAAYNEFMESAEKHFFKKLHKNDHLQWCLINALQYGHHTDLYLGILEMLDDFIDDEIEILREAVLKKEDFLAHIAKSDLPYKSKINVYLQNIKSFIEDYARQVLVE